MTSKLTNFKFAAFTLVILSGCSHQVVFDDSHYYAIQESSRGESMVAVITAEEIRRKDRTRAFSTGFANAWDAEPGVMLEQVAKIEMPQMFRSFRISRAQTNTPETFHLLLKVPYYDFSNHRASITVDAQLISPDRESLLVQSYSGLGPSGAGRMWGAGAFAMKSAIRNSSIGALKKIFENLRSDLNTVLDGFAQRNATRNRSMQRQSAQQNASHGSTASMKEDTDLLTDATEAVRWYREAAEQGHVDAQYELAVLYQNGQNVRKDEVEAAHWYREAAEQGHVEAQYELAIIHQNGQGVPIDEAEALRWFREAAEQGHADAQYRLAVSYRSTRDAPDDGATHSDDAQAVRRYHSAAEQGDPSAQYELALRYQNGQGVPQDEAEAVRWFREAAEQGHRDAQFNLAVRHHFGEGVSRDQAKAIRWVRSAAEQGHADAQYNLAVSYENGQGVPKDENQAMFWYRKAADQGHAKAQQSIGTSH